MVLGEYLPRARSYIQSMKEDKVKTKNYLYTLEIFVLVAYVQNQSLNSHV